MTKKSMLLLLLPLLLVLIVVGVLTVKFLTSKGSIEAWVGSQIKSIANYYLNPQLDFERLSYQYPKTVLLDNLTLSAPDPRQGGKGVYILSIKHARLELAEIPKSGQPIKIEQFILDSPEFRAIAIEPGSSQFVGYSQLLKSSVTAKDETTKAQTKSKLSETFQIRLIELKNGLIVYDPRLPNTVPMQLDNINTRLAVKPTAGGEAGWYALNTVIARAPIFNLAIDGKVNIDTMAMNLAKLTLNLDLKKENHGYLPPQIQTILNEYEVTGQTVVTISGLINPSDINASDIKATVDLTKAQFAYGEYRFPVDSFHLDSTVQKGLLTIPQMHAQLLEGTLDVTGTVPLDMTQKATIKLATQNIKIENTLRSVSPNKPPKYAGLVTTNVNFQAPLKTWNTAAAGGGELHIRNGRLAGVPMFTEIIKGLHDVMKITGNSQMALNDKADINFSFAGNRIHLDSLDAQGEFLTARGSGDIYFNQKLDLRLNAGPMEKVESQLGNIGKIVGQVTDKLATYHVTGTTADPKVTLEVGK